MPLIKAPVVEPVATEATSIPGKYGTESPPGLAKTTLLKERSPLDTGALVARPRSTPAAMALVFIPATITRSTPGEIKLKYTDFPAADPDAPMVGVIDRKSVV